MVNTKFRVNADGAISDDVCSEIVSSIRVVPNFPKPVRVGPGPPHNRCVTIAATYLPLSVMYRYTSCSLPRGPACPCNLFALFPALCSLAPFATVC